MDFKQALDTAAQQAHAAGTINSEQVKEIQEATKGKHRLAAIEAFVLHRHAAQAGGVGAPNWANLIAMIQGLMPLIAQLMSLFKKPAAALLLVMLSLAALLSLAGVCIAQDRFVVTGQAPVLAQAYTQEDAQAARRDQYQRGGPNYGPDYTAPSAERWLTPAQEQQLHQKHAPQQQVPMQVPMQAPQQAPVQKGSACGAGIYGYAYATPRALGGGNGGPVKKIFGFLGKLRPRARARAGVGC